MQLDFIGSVVEAAAAYDYDVLLSPSGADSDRSFQRLLGERRVDGAILMEIRLQDDRIDHLVAENFPAVCIGRTAQPDGDWWVGLDHTALAAACVDHLADLGHRRIALVNRPERMLRAGLRVGSPRPGRLHQGRGRARAHRADVQLWRRRPLRPRVRGADPA